MALESDDFSDGVLDDSWTIVGPATTSASLGASATDAYLQLVTPDGNHDLWGTQNNTVRAMQAISDGDFQLETRFLTTPTQQYQMQGFLVEQDANNWIRFDTYWNGSSLRAFGAVTINGVSSTKFDVVIPGGTAPYLRLTHTGNQWSFQYSTDGNTWTTAGTFSQALTIASAGVFAGNTGAATGYTALVDYFENTAAPIVDEDGTIPPINDPPNAQNDALTTDENTPLTINVAADILGNDTDPNGDTLAVANFTQPTHGTLVNNGNGTWTYTPNAGYFGPDSFTYTATDGSGTDIATVTLTVVEDVPPPTSSNVLSDDFSNGVLDPAWTIVGPVGTSAHLATTTSQAFLELVTPDGDHDLWGTQNNAVRAMQAVSNGVGSSRVDLQACKLEYSIVSPK